MAQDISKPEIPSGSPEYLWWQAGAMDEAKARDEKLTYAGKEIRAVLEGLAYNRPGDYWSTETLALALARIFCPAKLKRRYR